METLIPNLVTFFGGAGMSIAIMWYWLKDKDKTIDWLKGEVAGAKKETVTAKQRLDKTIDSLVLRNDKLTDVLITDRNQSDEQWDLLTNALSKSESFLPKEQRKEGV